ncbi:DMT family transporter [Rhodospirillaceae bacterium SYSU D60014]|uniref:DMT family transporter n=1 Tax=Virgifigura deserti TaxID=2268457 RepID=UPI000E670308
MTRSPIPVLLLEAGLVVAWSSGFIGAKLAADTPSVFLVLFWRFVIVAALLAPFVLQACRQGFGRKQIALQALLGALAMFAYLATGIKAIDLGVPAGTAALISALQPLATAALVGPWLGEIVRPRQWLGLGVGFAGVLVAVGGALGDAPLWAYGLCFVGMASLVVATLLAKAAAPMMKLLPALGIQSAVTALLFAPLALLEGGIMPPADAHFLAAVAWFILFSTVGGYGLYWLCLRRSTATRVGSLIYLTPPVTMLWAWAMFGEPLALAAVAGFALCVGGVALARGPSVPSAVSQR